MCGGLCGEVSEVEENQTMGRGDHRWNSFCPRTIVQAIYGFLFGFRRDDSVISKIQTIGIFSA